MPVFRMPLRNVIKKFAVGHRSDVHRSKSRRTRIFARSNLRFAAAIVGVTELALRTKRVATFGDLGRIGIGAEWIDGSLCLIRNALV